VTAFLRFLGILNAAVWCGSAIFIMVGVPALFSPPVKSVLGDWNTGLAAQTILARFFLLQYWCLGLGIAQVVIEWWFLSKPIWRFVSGLLAILTVFALVAGLWLQPKLIELHRIKYQAPLPEQRAQADLSFKRWHGASQSANLLVMIGLLVYLNQVTRVTENRRFVSSGKIRG
jgi:hypothetical protein